MRPRLFRPEIPFLLMLAVLAAGWRWHFCGRWLEYDEIWTLENFASLDILDIFSALDVPNNHPFNTLLVKLLYFPAHDRLIRLGSLLLSCTSVALCAMIARRLWNRAAAWYAAVAAALLPPFLTAGSTARGYAGQLFLLLFCAYCLLRCRKGSPTFTVLGAVGMILAVVALPSSVLYLAPMGIFFAVTMLKRGRLERRHVYLFGAAALFAAAWYYRHWFDFRETAKFAVPIRSWREFAVWLESVLHGNAVCLALLAAGVWVARKRRTTCLLLAVILFPLAAAAVTGAAPARVYLPSAAAAVLLTAPAAARRAWLFAASLLLAGVVSWSALPDRTLETIARRPETPGTLRVYSATDGYVVRYHQEQAPFAFIRQLEHAVSRRNIRMELPCQDGNISGIDIANDSQQWPFLPGAGENGIVALRRATALRPHETGFLLLPPMPETVMNGFLRNCAGLEVLKLNPWLTLNLTGRDGGRYRFVLLAVRSAETRNFPEFMPLFVPND